MLSVQGVLGQVAVEASYTSLLLDLLETLDLGLQLVNDFGGSNLVDLMEVAHPALDDFYQY
jgi:hypothetical protein